MGVIPAVEKSKRAHDVAWREAAMARMAEDLRVRVGIDPVTGLDTRARFESRVRQELKRAARGRHATSVAVFEACHRAGRGGQGIPGRLMSELADEIRAELRDVDTVGRLEGWRFAALLPMCDGACARQAVVRVLERLGRLPELEVVAGVASTADHPGLDLLASAEEAAGALRRQRTGADAQEAV